MAFVKIKTSGTRRMPLGLVIDDVGERGCEFAGLQRVTDAPLAYPIGHKKNVFKGLNKLRLYLFCFDTDAGGCISK